jgi:hypothetical protein
MKPGGADHSKIAASLAGTSARLPAAGFRASSFLEQGLSKNGITP